MRAIKIAPSVLSADFARLGDEVERVTQAGADWIHLDVMDGHFVPNLTMGPDLVSALRKRSKLTFDVHLMVSRPLEFVKPFAHAGANMISFHLESESDPVRVIRQIRRYGCRPAIAIKPGTPVSQVYPYLELVDMVLLMTVEPGFGGQKFMPEVMPKVEALREKIREFNWNTEIEVDGGISPKTVEQAAHAGANVFVAGSAVFNAADPQVAINYLRMVGENEHGKEAGE